ncbi:protein kinase [Stieleria sp. TO1_6]|uniref:serine/threonine-protein kinase n=1 Tax=Stieleria tagensis TaxID=2956795 RepID=UPI00209AAB15|nr:serine/threonine-protein kinase [Stieleria tagensis]MCO8123488.1 protein kinase [Stieleria tagensis]
MFGTEPVELLKRIDDVAEQYESSIKAGGDADLGRFLDAFSGDERTACFHALFALLVDYRVRKNLPIDLAEYQQRYPDLVGVMEQVVGDARKSMPKRIGPYELREKLGEGGMGTVFKAWHSRLRRYVALKMLPHETANDAELLARFDREMQAAGKLSHPNVVTASDADYRDGIHFLVMEFCDGMDLSKVIKRLGKIEVADACEIICQAADGLQHAHQHGLVHRDIKPSNLMLSRDGVVRILDMGLARLNTTDARELTSTGQVMGTFDYMSPEQASGSGAVDVRSDIYSLGMTLYKLLTGTFPFAPPQYDTTIKKLVAKASTPAPSVSLHRPDLPADVVQACDKMLMIDPDLRFADPKELRTVLQPYCQGADLMQLIQDAAEAAPDHERQTEPDRTTMAFLPASEIDTVSEHGNSLGFELNSTQEATQLLSQPSITNNDQRSLAPRKHRLMAKPTGIVGGTVGLLICGLIALWAFGLFTIKTPAGTLEIRSKGERFATLMQGKKITIKNTLSGETFTIDLKTRDERREFEPGQYVVLTSDSGLETFTKHFTIRSGEIELIEVRWKPNPSEASVVAPMITRGNTASPSETVDRISERNEREFIRELIEKGAEVWYQRGKEGFECNQVSEIPTDPAAYVFGIQTPAHRPFTEADFAGVAVIGRLHTLIIDTDKVDYNGLHHLKKLSLGRLQISLTNARSDTLELVATMTSLRTLAPGYVTKEQLRKLHPLVPTLQNLGFYSAGIQDKELAELGEFNQLLELTLTNNPDVTDAVIPQILKIPTLQTLRLPGTKVTDAGIMQLKQMNNLQLITLEGTQCTAAGVAKLRQALPACKIDF